jgi:hypothetical protein
VATHCARWRKKRMKVRDPLDRQKPLPIPPSALCVPTRISETLIHPKLKDVISLDVESECKPTTSTQKRWKLVVLVWISMICLTVVIIIFSK